MKAIVLGLGVVILGLNVVDVLVVPLEEGVALLSAVLGCELDVDLVGGLD